MKSLILLVTFLISIPSFASFNEVECQYRDPRQTIIMEVQEPFPRDAMTKDAVVEVMTQSNRRRFNFQVMTYITRGISRVRYAGGNYELEVDFWPDQRPQWGRTYRGRLQGNGTGSVFMNCRFPNSR